MTTTAAAHGAATTTGGAATFYRIAGAATRGAGGEQELGSAGGADQDKTRQADCARAGVERTPTWRCWQPGAVVGGARHARARNRAKHAVAGREACVATVTATGTRINQRRRGEEPTAMQRGPL